ncbi:MAG: ribosome maturation factor RimP [Clostridia bacterium]|nr:ribosome maturation factor RimP [Clostridia bacterium]
MKITQQVWEFSEPIVKAHGCEIWDVEYVREGADWFLRIYLDKEGGVDINDCEAISRAIDPILDEKDPIPDSYTFEVCSAGLERTLSRPSDFAKFMGADITVKLYQPKDGCKEYAGVLKDYDAEGNLTAEVGEKTVTFTRQEVANVRLRVDF